MSFAPITPSAELASAPVKPGQIIADRYLVGRVLGEGGMGIVCAGTHVRLGTPVAIKLIHSALTGNEEVMQRFANEARAAATLKGEHIARVFDAGQLPSGEPFLVMEQLEGTCLEQHLDAQGCLAQSEVVAIVLQVCEGLAEAHATGLVHRDIKPANLFLTRRPSGELSVKILDFGIAKHRARQDQLALTDPGKRLGSPSYMSPEQMLAPASVDERADIWSLGVLLFELLTGRLPFEGDTMAQISTAVLRTSPTPPSELRPGISKELDEVILRCLQREPQRRFCSVTDLALALKPLLLESFSDSVTPLPSVRDDRPLQATSRGRAVVALALALVMVSALLLAGSLQYQQPSPFRSAAGAMRIELPGDPQLLPDSPETLKPRDEPLRVLPTLSRAYAIAEPQREATAPPPAGSWPQRARGRARTLNGDDGNLSIAQIYGF